MKILKTIVLSIILTAFIIPAMAQTTGQLSFTCTTTAPLGNWGTKHVAAIWIQNNENPSIFIKTNAKYGSQDDHLTSWSSISNHNLTDAVTGATLTTYGTLSVQWDGTDVNHNVVMDGAYTLYIEMGWGRNKTVDHAVSMYSFTKGPNADQNSPADDNNFSSISLNWEPTATLISSVENKDGICVFPNPTHGLLRLNFQKDLRNVNLRVTDLSGKVFYTESKQKLPVGMKPIDIRDLPDGLYLLNISSEGNNFTYKVLVNK